MKNPLFLPLCAAWLLFGAWGLWSPESGFGEVRAIELLRLGVMSSIAIFAAGAWNDRSNKKSKQRDIFHGIVFEFSQKLNDFVQLILDYKGGQTSEKWNAIQSELKDLKHLKSHIEKHVDTFVDEPFFEGFDADIEQLDHLINWIPFENENKVFFPKGWASDVGYRHSELRRRCYNYMMEIFD